MDPITRMVAAGAAGAASGSSATYVDDVFSTFLYEGTGSTRSIDNGIDLSGEGGLVWIKERTVTQNHMLIDTVRGAEKFLVSNSPQKEFNDNSSLTAFNNDGFTIANGNEVNHNLQDFVSWTFRKAPGFFDVVTYTGSGSPQTIPHNLDSVPGMIIVKCTSHASTDWTVFHREAGHPAFSNGGSAYATFLNDTVVADPSAAYWDNTVPTSTVFTVGVGDKTNGDGKTYVAYLFAHDDARFGTNEDESIIKCGKFTVGAGSLTVDLGFEPQWVMIKRTSGATGSWVIRDVMRGWHKTGFNRLFADSDQTENIVNDSSDTYFPIYNTGFGSTSDWLSGNSDYIYVAIRRPNKPPTAGTDVFALDATSASGSTGNAFDAPFPVDMEWHQDWGSSIDKYVGARLISGKYLRSNSTSGELSGTAMTFDSSDGVITAFNTTDYSAQMFKRAPGFMDVVTYEGTGSVTTVNHNLAAVPELIILKGRDDSYNWSVYTQTLGRNKVLYLNEDEAASTFNAPAFWGSTDFTSTQFSLGTYWNTNRSGYGYVAYLFASLDGISKVGEYTGTGSNVNVDCGFSAGARFVLIKRTDGSNGASVGDWYMWDTAHGITTNANDPYILLNEPNSQVTNTDYIDPLNAGFTVKSSAPAALNASGGTYLFLAIA